MEVSNLAESFSMSYAWPRITPGHEVCLSKGDSWPKLMPGQELGLSTSFAWPVMTLDQDACVARRHAGKFLLRVRFDVWPGVLPGQE